MEIILNVPECAYAIVLENLKRIEGSVNSKLPLHQEVKGYACLFEAKIAQKGLVE